MPRIAELKQASNGAMWARLDMDWDGGPITIYTDIELKEMKRQIIKDVIYYLNNFDNLSVREDD